MFFPKILTRSSNTSHHGTNIDMALGQVLSQLNQFGPDFYNIHFNTILLYTTGQILTPLPGCSAKNTYDLPVSPNILCVFPISVFWFSNPNIIKWWSPFWNFPFVDKRRTDMFAKLKIVRQNILFVYSDSIRRTIFDYKTTFRKWVLFAFLMVKRIQKEVRTTISSYCLTLDHHI